MPRRPVRQNADPVPSLIPSELPTTISGLVQWATEAARTIRAALLAKQTISESELNALWEELARLTAALLPGQQAAEFHYQPLEALWKHSSGQLHLHVLALLDKAREARQAPGNSPDFSDPVTQALSPQSDILRLLSDLADTWQIVDPKTHAAEIALGVLALAKGVDVRGTPPKPREARLTIDGTRWQGHLRIDAGERATAVRAFVLQCVWESYLKHKGDSASNRLNNHPARGGEDTTNWDAGAQSFAGAFATAPTATGQGKGGTPPADPFADLRRFARDKLKGQERAVIEALCDAGGDLPIADLAVKDGVGWQDEFQGFKDLQRRLNPKLKPKGWRLERRNNAGFLVTLEERKRGQ